MWNPILNIPLLTTFPLLAFCGIACEESQDHVLTDSEVWESRQYDAGPDGFVTDDAEVGFDNNGLIFNDVDMVDPGSIDNEDANPVDDGADGTVSDVADLGAPYQDAVDTSLSVFEWCFETYLAPKDEDPLILEGSVTIENTLDVSALEPYDAITGRLFILAPGLTHLNLPNLTCVGTVQLDQENGDLESIEMANLRGIDGGFGLDTYVNPSVLRNIQFPALERVGGRLQLGNLPSLEHLSLPSLQLIGAFVSIQDTPVLFDVDLENLSAIWGHLLIQRNTSLHAVNLDRLVEVGGDIEIMENPQLPQCWADELVEGLRDRGYSGSVEITDNDLQATCE